MLADLYVVSDVDLVIDLGAVADPRVFDRAAVDGGARADFDIVANHHPPELRDLEMAARARDEAEAVLADMDAGMEDGAVTDDGMKDAA